MMSIDIRGLKSLQSEGESSLLVRVVGSLIVGLCLVVEEICRECLVVIASVCNVFCTHVKDFADQIVHKGAVFQGEFGALFSVRVLARCCDATSPPGQNRAISGATVCLWLGREGPLARGCTNHPEPPNGETCGVSSTHEVQTWHHPSKVRPSIP